MRVAIRVDDFPCGRNQDPDTVVPNWRDAWKRFHAAMAGVPYTVGVVPDWVRSSDVEGLRSQPEVTLALHGISHARDEFLCSEKEIFEKLQFADSIVHTDIFIPPFNFLNIAMLQALVRANYRYVTTGPETDMQVVSLYERSTTFTVVPPSWYGRASEFLERMDNGAPVPDGGCICFHWTWEWSNDYVALAQMIQRIRPYVVPWYELYPRRSA